MKYRIQVDLSFNTQEDADAFVSYVKTLVPKIYIPKLSDIIDRPDLFTNSRMHIIKDYDDEHNNQPGQLISIEELISPIME